MDMPYTTLAESPLSFAVLGPLSVQRGSTVLPIGPPQQSRLLALLAVQANRPVQRAALIEALWEGRPPASAVNIVQTYVARLRRVLEPQRPSRRPSCLLVSSGTSYTLRIPEERVDAFRFEQLVRQAASLAGQGWSAEAFDGYREALALWRGPAPADCAGAGPEAEPLARLSRLRFTAALALADLGLPLLRPREVADALEPLARLAPLHEALHARLVVALAGAGDTAAALGRFEAIRRRLRDELGISPGEELRRAHRQVLRAPEPGLAQSRPGGERVRERGRRWSGPPPGLPELIGRQADLGRLAALCARRQLTTVVGAPGCGKSALALRYAATVSQGAGQRVLVVALADCHGGAALREQLLALCGPPGPSGPPGVTVEERLAALFHEVPALLVLDDADQVAEAAAGLVERLIRRCPWVRVLVTSREPLGVVGEAIHQAEPLALPSLQPLSVDQLARVDSVALFCRRAEDACGFRLDAANAGAVAQLCRLLDGLPLALELAAACLRTMPIEDLVAGLDDRFMLLTMVRRGGPPHHRTLRACLEWSFARLTAAERAVLLRLAGQREPLSYREVMTRCAGLPVPTADLPALVNRLVDRSLVAVDRLDGRARYRVLGTIGAFAAATGAQLADAARRPA
ncbi:AfsR/SARP family transcriptional regulator [Kitasatospora kifunensis]|uniref:Putative ATPase/DNA-binding SARP family transcriptional activator n=1 Tax=Kitasatospora kifunensis TaxID=58351 RepID=A0A7W7QWH4_KITKI|nr:BTAD domain-containing putative transcriptional regulator [Kitasatospora kifunensis]MBB4921081.1 putative ATPase/DNA-binding SARP family transcriptional activator [Kitasatospora kifunensis]